MEGIDAVPMRLFGNSLGKWLHGIDSFCHIVDRADWWDAVLLNINPKQHQLRMFQSNEREHTIFDSDAIVQVSNAIGAREGQFHSLNWTVHQVDFREIRWLWKAGTC